MLLLAVNAHAQAPNPLFIPDTLAGPTYNLDLSPASVQFLPGDSTRTHGINQAYLGPTLIMNKGDFVQMHVTNNIPDTTTMHWHGMHVAPEDDGGPHTKILPGDTWSPDFTVLDEATTFWYHPHLHHKTAEQVYKGAAGMIIVRDSHEAALSLPRTYGVDDFPIIIQDKTFDAQNQFVFAPMNDTVMVNGTLNPILEVPAQMVRFRLLNGSNQRVYNIAIPPNLNAWQIGTDGGLLAAPLPITRMRLTPGERAEIVVNFGPQPLATVIPMPCNNTELGQGVSGGPGGPQGSPGNGLDNQDFPFIRFRVVPPTANAVTMLSQNLNTYDPWDEQDAVVTRLKVFDTIPPNGFPYFINSILFDHNVVNDTVYLDDTEIWTLVNHTNIAHPFHIHDIQFYILDINGLPAPPHWQGKKDVVLSLPGDSIRFIAKFTDFVDPHIPYMYHCHNLFHEDAGMMGQFIVLEKPTGAEEASQSDLSGRFKAFPNPTTGLLQLEDQEKEFRGISSIEIRNLQGQLLRKETVRAGKSYREIDLSELPGGMYLVELKGKAGKATLRTVKE